ncbi:Threonylcarbamoyl-AMP synthase [Commensalibacter sp. Nvir]|uniref:L-threonylcarbamoyladenylate synthase n=1 Tax=Commensalibacter sp. Nvir TaxID=3069817 RepID=UPI002D26CF59|nr:Threonylcarbamoyl-AMP synthase [Commensalibacter sp. Nvir]
MTYILSSSEADIRFAASLINQGGIVAFGTETVYGLGADATNTEAVNKIYKAKGRPSTNPLIIHFDSIDHVFNYVEKTPLAYKLATKFWPGPLTLVLNKRNNSSISPVASSNLNTLAVRIPNTQVALKFIHLCEQPLAAPSANVSGKVSPTTAQHVLNALNDKIDAIIDNGPCQVGVESTILDLSSEIPTLLRPGGVSFEALRSLCGVINLKKNQNEKIIAPGQLSSHYATTLSIRLNANCVAPNEALLAFGVPLQHNGLCKNLSLNMNLEEAAKNLFDSLHYLDREGLRLGLKGIAVMPIPKIGVGLAICDRLQRASAPK